MMLRPGGRGLLSTVRMIFRGRVGVEPGDLWSVGVGLAHC